MTNTIYEIEFKTASNQIVTTPMHSVEKSFKLSEISSFGQNLTVARDKIRIYINKVIKSALVYDPDLNNYNKPEYGY